MKRASRFLPAAVAALTFWAPTRGVAQPVGAIRVSPTPEAIRAGMAAEPMDAEYFLEAALFLSGGTGEERDRARGILRKTADEALRSIPGRAEPAVRAEALLAYLHSTLLRRYVENQTRADAAALGGDYNCVSSAVLYAYLAKKAGLDVNGVRTADHALCSVVFPGRAVDVETTNRYGFDPGSKKEFQDSFGRVTGYSYVPPSRKDARRTIGDREFLGLILSNRIAGLELRGRWEEAVGLAADYHALVGTAEARDFLLDRVSNLTAGLHSRQDWEGAFSVLSSAASALGPSPRLSELEAVTAQAALSWFGSRGDWEGGLAYARTLKPSPGADPRVKELTRVLAEGRLRERVRKAPFEEAIPAVEEAGASGILDARRRAELLEYLYGSEANSVAKSSGWRAGIRVIEEGLTRVPGSGVLASAKRIFQANWTAQTHNLFAAHFNARRFEEAARVLEEGLALDPGNPTLLKDLETLKNAR